MKKVINETELVFSAVSENESFARCAVASFCAQLDPTLEELSDIRTPSFTVTGTREPGKFTYPAKYWKTGLW